MKNIIHWPLFLILFLGGALIRVALADVVFLKSGIELTGTILEENENWILLDLDGLEIRLYTDEFQSYRKEPVKAVEIKMSNGVSVAENSNAKQRFNNEKMFENAVVTEPIVIKSEDEEIDLPKKPQMIETPKPKVESPTKEKKTEEVKVEKTAPKKEVVVEKKEVTKNIIPEKKSTVVTDKKTEEPVKEKVSKKSEAVPEAEVKLETKAMPVLEPQLDVDELDFDSEPADDLTITTKPEKAKQIDDSKLDLTGKAVLTYIRSVIPLSENFHQQLAYLMGKYREARRNNDQSKAISVMTQRIQGIEEMLGQLNKILVPNEARALHQILLEYYQSMQMMEGYVLKGLSGEKDSSVELNELGKKLVELERASLEEVDRLIEKYDLNQYMEKTSSIENMSFDDRKLDADQLHKITLQLVQENRRLLVETRQLNNVNKKLQAEMRAMLEANKIVQEQQIQILDYEKLINKINQKKQEVRFKRYLNEL